MQQSALILPTPQQITATSGTCEIESSFLLSLPTFWKQRALTARFEQNKTVNYGCLRCTIDDTQAERSYLLSVRAEQILIRAATVDAIAHGIKTLYQYAMNVLHGACEPTAFSEILALLPTQITNHTLATPPRSIYPPRIALPATRIADEPRVAIRGYMLDISRDRVPTMETLFLLIRILGLLKYNQLQLYSEHTFAYKAHRTVWQDASPLTADELRALDQYAADEGIALVPNQNTLGHMERWFKHKQYHHLAECPNGFYDPWGVFRAVGSTRAVADPQSDAFVFKLLDEYAPLFQSSCIHVGYDEPWEFAQGSSTARAEAVGSDVLFYQSIIAINRHCRLLQKKMLIWADVALNYPDAIAMLPKDVGLCVWGYKADYPMEKQCQLIRERLPAETTLFLCCGSSTWNSITSRLRNATKNIEQIVACCVKYHANGALLTEWGDNGHFQQLPITLPAIASFAEQSWGGARTSISAASSDTTDMRLQKWMDRYVCAMPTQQRYAPIIFKIATLAEEYDLTVPNGTILHALLLGDSYQYGRSLFPQYKNRNYDALQRTLQQITVTLAALPPSLLGDELRWTVDCARFATTLAKAVTQRADCTIAALPLDSKAELASALPPLIARYQSLWKRRCRIGGLRESGARFEALLSELRPAP